MGAEDRAALLEEATKVVTQDRNKEYGGPEDSFSLIAELWEVYLNRRESGPINSGDVALMLDLLKTARLMANMRHRDSWVDKAGYAACGFDVTRAEVPF